MSAAGGGDGETVRRTASKQPNGDDQPRGDMTAGVLDSGGKVDRDALYALYEQNEGDDESPVSVRFKLQHDLDKRLDRYLVDRIPFLSRTSLQRLIREESVTVNGRAPKASTKLHKDDVVVAVLPPPPSSAIPPEAIPLNVLYEDEHLIVLNKQADIIVHPARGNKTGTLLNALAHHFQARSSGALSSVGEEFARPGVVHRLDRHTTGVMAVAKTDTAHWRLAKQFEDRKTHKRYLALVHGELEPHADVIDLPLGKHPTMREKYAVRWDATGKPSVTLYYVREVYQGFTLVELDLKTGRTHQIRVHLAHLGYPVVGDDMYGGKALHAIDAGDAIGGDEVVVHHQALHAAMLEFTHPISGEAMRFTAPLPVEFRRAVELLRKHRMKQVVKSPGARVEFV